MCSWSNTRNSIGIGPYSRRIKIAGACFSPCLFGLSHTGQTIPDVVPGRYEPTAVALGNLFRLRPYRVQIDGRHCDDKCSSADLDRYGLHASTDVRLRRPGQLRHEQLIVVSWDTSKYIILFSNASREPKLSEHNNGRVRKTGTPVSGRCSCPTTLSTT